MSIKITSGGALARMQKAEDESNRVFNHNVEPDIRAEWLRLTVAMYNCRKAAMEKNEKHKELTK